MRPTPVLIVPLATLLLLTSCSSLSPGFVNRFAGEWNCSMFGQDATVTLESSGHGVVVYGSGVEQGFTVTEAVGSITVNGEGFDESSAVTIPSPPIPESGDVDVPTPEGTWSVQWDAQSITAAGENGASAECTRQ